MLLVCELCSKRILLFYNDYEIKDDSVFCIACFNRKGEK